MAAERRRRGRADLWGGLVNLAVEAGVVAVLLVLAVVLGAILLWVAG